MKKEKIVFTIKTSFEYGMFCYWHLVKAAKNEDGSYRCLNMWCLGQDVKVCSRILGMEPRDVMSSAKISKLTTEKDKIKLAKFIMNHLEIDAKKLEGVKSWELACE